MRIHNNIIQVVTDSRASKGKIYEKMVHSVHRLLEDKVQYRRQQEQRNIPMKRIGDFNRLLGKRFWIDTR